MGNRWYVSLDGKELGPLSDSGLERMIQSGRIDGDALVRNGRTGARTTAREIESQIAARPTRQRPRQDAIDQARGAKPPRPPAPPSKIPPLQVTRLPATSLAAAESSAAHSLQPESDLNDALPPPDDLPLEAPRDDLPLAAVSNSCTLRGGDSLANRWYVMLGGEELGPLSDSGLERLVHSGGVLGDTLVRNGRDGSWISASTVPGLLSQTLRLPASPGGGAPQPAPQPPRTGPQAPPSAAPPASPSGGRRMKWRLAAGACAVWLVVFLASWAVARATSSHYSQQAAGDRGAGAQLDALKQEADLLQQQLLAARRQLDDLRSAPLQPPSTAPPPPPPADVTAERKSLAEAIARDWAAQEDAAARLRHELSHVIDPALDAVAAKPYQSQADDLFRKKLPEAERELTGADAAQLAQRRQSLQHSQAESQQKAQQLFADAKAAIKRGDLERADELFKQYLGSGYAERREDAVTILKELTSARPTAIGDDVLDLSQQQQCELASTQRLPAAWPRKYSDPDVAEAARQMAVRVATLFCGFSRDEAFLKRLLADRNAYELCPLRKSQLAHDIGRLDYEHDLTPAKVTELIDAYGFFNLADLAPQIDDAITLRLSRLIRDDTEAMIERLTRGEIKFESLGELCRKARQMAGDAWPADDAALPYAGHWVSRDRWHLYIDPWRDAIVFRKSSPAASREQRVCKLAPGYLVGCERRTYGAVDPSVNPTQNPFWKEKFDGKKDDIPEDVGPEADKIVALTLYVFKPGNAKTLRLYRRYKNPSQGVRNEELKGQAFWKSLGDESLYRPYEDVYRFVDDKLAPE